MERYRERKDKPFRDSKQEFTIHFRRRTDGRKAGCRSISRRIAKQFRYCVVKVIAREAALCREYEGVRDCPSAVSVYCILYLQFALVLYFAEDYMAG